MTTEEKYRILLERIRRWADFERSHEEVVNEASITAEGAGITYEEIFAAGMNASEAYNTLECRDLLRSIKELGNEALN